MTKYIFIFSILFFQNLFCQTDSIKLIDKIYINLSTQNDLSWERYNKKLKVKPLIFSGQSVFNGKYHKNGEIINFERKINHKKGNIDIVPSYSIQDKDIDVFLKQIIKEIFGISNFYYFTSNKKGEKPYNEFAFQKENNTWSFNYGQ